MFYSYHNLKAILRCRHERGKIVLLGITLIQISAPSLYVLSNTSVVLLAVMDSEIKGKPQAVVGTPEYKIAACALLQKEYHMRAES